MVIRKFFGYQFHFGNEGKLMKNGLISWTLDINCQSDWIKKCILWIMFSCALLRLKQTFVNSTAFFLSNDLKSKVRTIVSACILQYHGAPLLLVDILSYMNMTFTLCFTVECVLKLIAFGPGVNSSKCDEGPSLNVRPYYS